MRSAPVAADQVSQLKCNSCSKPIERIFSSHVCGGCHHPIPLSSSEDYFSAFGVARRFNQDMVEIERRFYEISRTLHPDRFTTASPDTRRVSLDRMSFLNEAYRTLKDPWLRREYLLSLERVGEGVGADAKQVPMELAESWFDLQETFVEDPTADQTAKESKIEEFERQLGNVKKKIEDAVRTLENEIDTIWDSKQRPDRTLLEKLGKEIQGRNYLRSMERDITRFKMRLRGPS